MFRMHGPPMGINRKFRGFVGLRFWILNLLSSIEMTGAEIIKRVEELSMGMWRPSPGSVYPILRDLENEGYIASREEENKKYYSLTKKGKEMYSMFAWPERMWRGEFYSVDPSVTKQGGPSREYYRTDKPVTGPRRFWSEFYSEDPLRDAIEAMEIYAEYLKEFKDQIIADTDLYTRLKNIIAKLSSI